MKDDLCLEVTNVGLDDSGMSGFEGAIGKGANVQQNQSKKAGGFVRTAGNSQRQEFGDFDNTPLLSPRWSSYVASVLMTRPASD